MKPPRPSEQQAWLLGQLQSGDILSGSCSRSGLLLRGERANAVAANNAINKKTKTPFIGGFVGICGNNGRCVLLCWLIRKRNRKRKRKRKRKPFLCFAALPSESYHSSLLSSVFLR